MLIINKLCFAVPERTLYLIGKPLIVLFLIFIKTLYSLYSTLLLHWKGIEWLTIEHWQWRIKIRLTFCWNFGFHNKIQFFRGLKTWALGNGIDGREGEGGRGSWWEGSDGVHGSVSERRRKGVTSVPVWRGRGGGNSEALGFIVNSNFLEDLNMASGYSEREKEGKKGLNWWE